MTQLSARMHYRDMRRTHAFVAYARAFLVVEVGAVAETLPHATALVTSLRIHSVQGAKRHCEDEETPRCHHLELSRMCHT